MGNLINLFLLLSTFVLFLGCESETETTSPTSEQVAYAREFLYINPELKIEPIGFVEKNGFDHHVRLKFIAKTDDPTFLFDKTEVPSGEFSYDFNFPEPEASIDEYWWDVYSMTVIGENFRVPKSEYHWRLSVGYFINEDSTLTVYAWRHEYGWRDEDGNIIEDK